MDIKKRVKTEVVKKDELTPKQRRFVQELVLRETEISAQQCAINAGYEESSARQKATALQNPKYFPKVALEIQRFRDEVNKTYAANKGNHLRQLARLRDNAVDKGQFGPAIVAEYRRGQVAGLYVEKKLSLTGSIDNLTREQAINKFKDLLNQNPKLLENVSYEEEQEKEPKKIEKPKPTTP